MLKQIKKHLLFYWQLIDSRINEILSFAFG
jgi:hypothetical protein